MRLKAGTSFIILLGGMIAYVVLTKTCNEGFVDPGRCGVDLPSCQGEHIRCMNGYCKSDIIPKWVERHPLPMTPPTAYPYQ